MEQKIRILLAEDDINLGTLLKEYLFAKGYETDLYENIHRLRHKDGS